MKFHQYLTYTAIDFSTDPFFLEWRWFQTEETTLFWREFLSEHPEKSKEISLAIKIVSSVIDDNEVLFSKQDKENAVKKLTGKVYRYKKRKKIGLYALSTVVILVSLLFLPLRNPHHVSEVNEKIPVEIPEKEVQLVLSTGDKTFFKEDIQVKYDTEGNIVIQNQAGEMIGKHERDEASTALNRLIVPKGKRSSLLLADGSRIWVNSGSVVEFPSAFTEAGERKIRIEGEIYIEVEKDPQRPFLVVTSDFEVTVLGTRFNVSAYTEDAVHHVTVAEGLVSIVSGEEKQKNLVAQNQQLRIDKTRSFIHEVDVYNYISWKDGILRFESEPLGNILTRLSRYYDINLEHGKDIESVHCSGKLFLFDEWQMVFDNITKVSPVEYSAERDKIIFRYNSKK